MEELKRRRSSQGAFSLCARARKCLTSGWFVRWCNGNTALFGGVIHGSNPCRTATFAKEIQGSTNLCTEFARIPARQTAGDLAAVLEDIEMPPGEHLRVVITEREAARLRTARQRPQLGGLADLQKHRAACPFKAAWRRRAPHPFPARETRKLPARQLSVSTPGV